MGATGGVWKTQLVAWWVDEIGVKINNESPPKQVAFNDKNVVNMRFKRNGRKCELPGSFNIRL